MNIVYNIEKEQICNPSGLHRSVEKNNTFFTLHPVRNASLQDARGRWRYFFLPIDASRRDAMMQNAGTVYDNQEKQIRTI
jgi:hypothetical protein